MGRLVTSFALGLVALLAPAGTAEAARPVSLNASANRPPGVTAERFAALSRATAATWRIRLGRSTSRVAGRRDGVNVLSFSSDLPPGALGAYEAWGIRQYTRRCRGTGASRRCQRVRRDRVLEGDVLISPHFRWNPGPRYPTSQEVDLETVMVHELGHYAQPEEPHRQGCENHPLVESLGLGEWWRSPTDWYRRGCVNAPSAPAAAARSLLARPGAPAPRVAHIEHWITRPER